MSLTTSNGMVIHLWPDVVLKILKVLVDLANENSQALFSPYHIGWQDIMISFQTNKLGN